MKTNKEKHINRFIKSICKNKTKEEVKQAELNFLRYIKLVEKVATRITNQQIKKP